MRRVQFVHTARMFIPIERNKKVYTVHTLVEIQGAELK